MPSIETHNTIIIGGGIAGLSSALHLAERDLKPLLLEADFEYLGGRLAGGETVNVNGYEFRLEHGMHGIWSQYRNFQAMLARHNLRPVFVPAEKENWIYRKHGKTTQAEIGSTIRRSFLPAPFHYLALFLRPSFWLMLDLRDWLLLPLVWMGLVMGIGVDPHAEAQPLEGMTVKDLTRKWSPAVRALFIGLARNGLSTVPDEMPLSGFLAFLRFYTLLRRDAWVFSYLPEDGGTSVTEPLGQRIRSLGGITRKGARVTSIARDGEKWLVCWESAQGQEFARAEHIILATDSQNAKKLLETRKVASNPVENHHLGHQKNAIEPASKENLLGLSNILFPKSLENAVVRLWFDAKPKTTREAGIFTGEFILHNYFWLDRLNNPFRRWARETGGSAIEAHIYGPDEMLNQPDAVILAQAIQDVQSVWKELRGHRIYAHIQRNPATHTLPEIMAKENQLGIKTPWENLYCAGDWVQDTTPAFFIERACITGIKAANMVLESEGIATLPLLSYLPPEPLAAWIEHLMQGGRGRVRRRKKVEKAK